MSPRIQLWAPCALALLLTACGGSSGTTPSASDTPAPGTPMTMDPDPVPTSLDPVADTPMAIHSGPFSADEGQRVLTASAVSASVLRDALAAAATPPAFGSITQSAGGASAPNVRATTDGRSFAVTLPRPDGGTLTLDSATDATWRETYPTDLSIDSVVHSAELVHAADGAITLVELAGLWIDSDPADYVAFGYWLHLDGDLPAGAVTSATAGAFVDGPAYRLGDRPTLPALGTARYSGEASGFYALDYGSASGRAGRTEAGQFFAEADLVANFGAGTIAGCIGCRSDDPAGTAPDGWRVEGQYDDPVDGIRPTADYHDAAGYTDTPESAPSRFVIRLGATPFDAAGTFRGTAVTLESAGAVAAAVTQSSGAWGGMFSNVPGSSGDPRAVAGTVGAEGTTADGSQVAAIGFFYAPEE